MSPTTSGSWGDLVSRLRTAVAAAAYVIALLASLFLMPTIYALAAVLLLTVLFVLFDAMGNRILFKMAVRNVVRRPGTTVLVLAGLMVGTAIISATMVVGDTFDSMIVGEVSDGYGEADFIIAGQENGDGLYNASDVSSIRDQLLSIDHVDSAEWFLAAGSGIRNLQSGVTLPTVSIYGLTSAAVTGLGGFISTDGTPIGVLPGDGHIFVNEDLARILDLAPGDVVTLSATPSLGDEPITLDLTVETVVAGKAIGGMGGSRNVFLDLASAQQLRGLQDGVNALAVSLDAAGRESPNVTRDAIAAALAEPDNQALGLEIDGDRAMDMEDGRANVSMFTSLFLVFGSFSIIAGVVLIVNIFTMLGEERKSEMGMSRAVGMQRRHLRKLFIYEGLIYALATSAIGSAVGLLLAYGLINAVSMIVDLGDVAIADYFSFTPTSLLIAYLAGFLLTMVSIYGVTRRISNMNIVRAIRNIPEPLRSRGDKQAFRLGLLLLAIGAAIMYAGMSSETLGVAMGGLSLMTMSIGLIARRFIGDRIAWTVAGLLTLLQWMPGIEIFPYIGNIEMFVLSGVFMVTSLLIVVMFNSDPIVAVLTRLLRVKGGYKAVLKTAVSYPLRAKGRTAMSMFIFGLVIFTVTTLSMMSGMLGVGIPKMIDDTSGGFDVIAFSWAHVDMWAEINGTDGFVDPANITDIVQLTMGGPTFTIPLSITPSEEEPRQFGYNAIGVVPALYERGNYPLADWNRTLYPTEKDVWLAVQNDPTLVILDGSALPNDLDGTGMSINAGLFQGVAIGDRVNMTGRMGDDHSLTIIGFMEQSSFSGAYMNRELVAEASGMNGTNLFMIKLVDGADGEKQSLLLQNQFWAQRLTTIPISSMAQDAVAQINGIFDLIKAFLAMGLIIGITGLGIVTIRSIHERRVEIGMMRAIGYTKRMIVANFAMESAFVAILGILIGTFLGIVVGYELWGSAFNDMGIDFMVPWAPILLVGLGALAATLLTVLPAARGASKVSPAEVLRFE